MKFGFYARLAFTGIRRNKRIFTPFILTCTGMVMMFYIILYLAVSDILDPVLGGDILRQMFSLGSWVIAIFAAIFLFYTNSFLIRRRKKEFGLYNILGMGKGNIARILFWETLIIAAVSMAAGLVAGIACSKFAELGMVNVLHAQASYKLTVSPLAILRSLEVFGAIFLLLLLHSIRQVRFASAISLLRSENAGEKPPKGNWLLGILGVALLAAGYYLAVTTENPIAALLVFFAAVVLVIIGTYLVMISGSVLFCRILQKNRRYYYKPDHFVSVSSMAYRMKRNGAGLASICILATMVLVMMSSTACLYFGEQSAIRTRYPRDLNMLFTMTDVSAMTDENQSALTAEVDAVLRDCGAEPSNILRYRRASVSGLLDGSQVILDVRALESFSLDTYNQLYQFCFVPLSDYNALTGQQETLEDGQAIIQVFRGSYDGQELSFQGGRTFRIVKQSQQFPSSGENAMMITPSMLIVVPDLEAAVQGLDSLADYSGNQMLYFKYEYDFDVGGDGESQEALYDALRSRFHGTSEISADYGVQSASIECREAEQQSFYSLFGSLFYLGIILSLVFVLAAVLIIYYKQISEGYEDQARFEIMQKVGMTKGDIRKTVNSQLLTVFFLPLLLAALHICFAFPIIRRLLLAFNLNDAPLFVATTAISVGVFALLYAAVYRLTSNAYYQIVSGVREGR